MPTFLYKAKDRAGNTVDGTVDAADLGEAAGKVREMGFWPLDLRQDGGRPQSAEPKAPTGTTKKGPFFNFQLARLNGGSYSDEYKTPYFYIPSGPGGYPANTSVSVSGNTLNALRVSATPVRYVNPETVQIISAGFDKRFGNASTSDFTPGTASYSPGGPGGDDQANFNNGLILGAGQ